MRSQSSLIVTTSWDDGSIFDLKIAELLSKYGIKGTFYVPKSLFAHPLSASDIREIDEHFEVGSHTLNHVNLTKVSTSEAKKEIEEGKAYLEDLLGHNVCMFAYPDGGYNENIKKMVRDSGFVAARTAKAGDFNLPVDHYEWQITLLTSDGSPLGSLKTCLRNRLSPKALLEWGTRAKLVFDRALALGGIYHIYGHSLELEINLEWDKLEGVLDYISGREGVQYMSNGEIFQHSSG